MSKRRPQNKHLQPLQPGQSGNPAGRPKDSRNKLGEALLEKLCADFDVHGETAIISMRTERPHEYVKVSNLRIHSWRLGCRANEKSALSPSREVENSGGFPTVLCSRVFRTGDFCFRCGFPGSKTGFFPHWSFILRTGSVPQAIGAQARHPFLYPDEGGRFLALDLDPSGLAETRYHVISNM